MGLERPWGLWYVVWAVDQTTEETRRKWCCRSRWKGTLMGNDCVDEELRCSEQQWGTRGVGTRVQPRLQPAPRSH